MKFNYDKVDNIFVLTRSFIMSDEVSPGIILDYSQRVKLLGLK